MRTRCLFVSVPISYVPVDTVLLPPGQCRIQIPSLTQGETQEDIFPLRYRIDSIKIRFTAVCTLPTVLCVARGR